MNPKVTINDYKKAFVSKRKQAKQELVSGINSTFTIMLALIVSLLLYYVWILNANATSGYDIRQLEIEKQELLLEKEQIKAKISELESLSTIINEEDLTDTEKVEEPDYLVIKQGVQYVYNN